MESGSTACCDLREPYPREQVIRINLADHANVRRISSYPIRKNAKLPPLLKSEGTPRTAESPSEGHSSVDEFEDQSTEYSAQQIDPMVRVKQLERNLAFVKEHNQLILKCLHNEVSDLNRRNRELQFQLVLGQGPDQPESDQGQMAVNKIESLIATPLIKAALPREVTQHIEKLEREVRRLRYALGETLKMNANLRTQVIWLKEDRRSSVTSFDMDAIEQKQHTFSGPSPQVDHFSETLQEIHSANITSRKQSNSQFLPPISK